MEVEFNSIKNNKNIREHGLDFIDVIDFGWDDALYFLDERRDYKERRIIAVGYFNNRLTFLGYTIRNEAVRPFTWRKANEREVIKYGKPKYKK